MKKIKEQKGFTLVELLVVIAILAVLATVSVVGYTSFISKANNSNALTECKQAEDIVLSDLISTGKEVDAVKTFRQGATTKAEHEDATNHPTVLASFSYSVGAGKVSIDTEVTSATDVTDAMHKVFPDTGELDGYFLALTNDRIVYITHNLKGIAVWHTEKNPSNPTAEESESGISIESLQSSITYSYSSTSENNN